MIWVLSGAIILFAAIAFAFSMRPHVQRKIESPMSVKKHDISKLEKEVFAKADEVSKRCDFESSFDLTKELEKAEAEVRNGDSATMRSISRKVNEVQRLSDKLEKPETEKKL